MNPVGEGGSRDDSFEVSCARSLFTNSVLRRSSHVNLESPLCDRDKKIFLHDSSVLVIIDIRTQ